MQADRLTLTPHLPPGSAPAGLPIRWKSAGVRRVTHTEVTVENRSDRPLE
ncbi:MAG: hypothetical protein IPK19_40575 [Chloroflexi bacterium]|nr:hypothetical protein [Chloroflexota bacterium]